MKAYIVWERFEGYKEQLVFARTAAEAKQKCRDGEAEEGIHDELRPASRAHLDLVAAVLVCVEKGIWHESIRRFVDEALDGIPDEKGDD